MYWYLLKFLTLENLSLIFSLATPLILLIWFLYTQSQNYSKNYCKEIEGIYAGFVSSKRNFPEKKGLKAGIIMYIKDVDNNGFFKGELEFGEIELTLQQNIPVTKPISLGIYTFLGKLDYKFYFNKVRNPLNIKENRVYKGNLYIIVRLDFQFETRKMEDYLKYEYKIVHYREMKTLKFTMTNKYNERGQKLPSEFTLYKSGGFRFEPLKGVNDIVFKFLGKLKKNN